MRDNAEWRPPPSVSNPNVKIDPARVSPSSSVNIVVADDGGFVLYVTYVMAPPDTHGPLATAQAVRKMFVAQTFSDVFEHLKTILPQLCGNCS